ncbi:hypothetical protein C4K14_2158 [Pseudomonas chlororaphis subsp. aureofaciens]|nr:hypothetical protein C4K14_2158 [Pseudomonas chlororaphis subsp. aureofaciens]
MSRHLIVAAASVGTILLIVANQALRFGPVLCN